MEIFGGTFQTLGNSLDYAALKNRTISNNIANADTPNYKAKDVAFKNMLNNAVSSLQAKRTRPEHIPFQDNIKQNNYSVVTKQNTMYGHNGNSVDIDKEMAELAKNQIYYQGLVDRLNGKFRDLQTVIRGGR